MATRAVTVRLEEDTIKRLDELAKIFAHRWRTAQDPIPLPGSQAFEEAHLTRSDVIRICITGFLMEHAQILVKLQDERDQETIQ